MEEPKNRPLPKPLHASIKNETVEDGLEPHFEEEVYRVIHEHRDEVDKIFTDILKEIRNDVYVYADELGCPKEDIQEDLIDLMFYLCMQRRLTNWKGPSALDVKKAEARAKKLGFVDSEGNITKRGNAATTDFNERPILMLHCVRFLLEHIEEVALGVKDGHLMLRYVPK